MSRKATLILLTLLILLLGAVSNQALTEGRFEEPAANIPPIQADDPAPQPTDSGSRRMPERIPDEILAEFENMTVQEFLAKNKGPVPRALQQFDDTPTVVIVEMEGAPLAQVYAEQVRGGMGTMSALAQQDYAQSLTMAQEVVASDLTALGGQVIDQYTKAYNGLLVQLPANQQGAAAQLPGVKAVHQAPLHSPTLTNSVPFINADMVWGELGIKGDGITVAIIDSGIDYTHAAFGGIGTEAAYTDNDPTTITSTVAHTETFPTAKVVGGWDFAGTDYNPSAGVTTPVPDSDPLDEGGHGTHVASTVAGFEVPGNIGAGVAPSATLYALKIFGADPLGTTNLTLSAIEWAMDPNDDGDMSDHVDVINMSLGGNFGPATNPDAVAADNAAAIGVIVVCSAGNAGDTPYIVGGPSTADAAISVAASSITDTIGIFSSRGPRGPDSHLKPEITAPGVAIFAAKKGGGDTGISMDGTSMAAPHIAGVAALMREAHLTWTVEQIKAAMMNTTADLEDETPVPRQGAGRVDAYQAVSADTLAIGDDDLVSLSWGLVTVGTNTYTDAKVVTLNNFTTTKTYSVTWYFGPDSQTAGFDLSIPATVNVGAGTETAPASVTIPVTLTLDPAQLPLDFSPILEEYSGYVAFVNTTVPTDVLRIPFYAVPRPYSQLTLDASTQGIATTVALTHTGPVTSLLTAFPVYAVDVDDSGQPDEGDLRFVAVDYDSDDPTYGDMFAAVFATWGPWHTPQLNVAEFDLYLDVDQDGNWDFVDFNWNYAAYLSGGVFQNDAWVVIRRNLSDNSLALASPYYIVSDFNAGLMQWRLPATWNGMGGGDTDFDFRVAGVVLRHDGVFVDLTDSYYFDYARLPYDWSATGNPGPANPTSTLSVVSTGSGAQGVLVVDYNGQPGQGQAYFVPIAPVYYIYLPTVLNNYDPSQLLQNGDFDTGTWAPWQTVGSPALTDQVYHSTSYSVRLAGRDNVDSDYVAQEVTVPSNAVEITLDFWYRVSSDDPSPADYLCVEILDSGFSTVLASVVCPDLYSVEPKEQWINYQHVFTGADLTPLLGQTVLVSFQGWTDATNPSTVWVDDVSFRVTGVGP